MTIDPAEHPSVDAIRPTAPPASPNPDQLHKMTIARRELTRHDPIFRISAR